MCLLLKIIKLNIIIMSNYNNFKNKFFNKYPQLIDKNFIEKYVYKLVNGYLIVLKQLDGKEKDCYIANDKYAKHFCNKMSIKLICKMHNLVENTEEISSKKKSGHVIKYKKHAIISSHFYKTLEVVYYQYVKHNLNYTGKYIEWYSNGNKFAFGNFFSGKKNGHWCYLYDNGEKQIIGNYVDDERNGTFIKFNKLGEKIKEKIY